MLSMVMHVYHWLCVVIDRYELLLNVIHFYG